MIQNEVTAEGTESVIKNITLWVSVDILSRMDIVKISFAQM